MMDSKRLKSQLRTTMERVQPNPEYVMKAWLRGVPSHPNTRKQVGEWFGLEMDERTGSRIELSRDRLTGALVLNRLCMPIKETDKLHGAVYVQGMQVGHETGYISYAKIYNHTHTKSVTWDPENVSEVSRKLLVGHDIDSTPPNPDQNYRVWLGANVLSRATAWELMERIHVDRDMDNTVSIVRDQSMPEDVNFRTDSLAIVQTVTRHEDDLIKMDQRTLSFEESAGRSHIMHMTGEWETSVTGKLINNNKFRSVTPEVIEYFSKLLAKAQDDRF